jgi:hypothetical protein
VRHAVSSRTVTGTVVRAATFAVALAAGLLLAWPAGPALAAPASTRPAAAAGHVPERFHLTSGDPSSSRQHVQATGIFTARGYARAGDFASGHAVSRLVFRRGAIRLVTKATQRSASVPDASTCKFTEVFSGDYVIRGGTARYRHASGSGIYVTRIFGRLKKARGGGCGTRLASFWQSTRTRGTVYR